MTALIVIASIVLFFALVLSIPVVMYAEYDKGGFKLRVRYGLIVIKLSGYPKKEKKPKVEKPPHPKKLKKKQEKEEKKKLSPRTAKELIDIVLMMVKSTAGPVWKLIRSLYIRKLHVHYHVDKGDPAETAIACGEFHAYLYSAYAVLAQVFRFRDVSIVVTPVFYEYEHSDRVYVVVSALPRSAIACALRSGLNFIKSVVARRLQPQKESGAID